MVCRLARSRIRFSNSRSVRGRHCERKRSNPEIEPRRQFWITSALAKSYGGQVVASLLAMTVFQFSRYTSAFPRRELRPDCAGNRSPQKKEGAGATLKRREGAGNAGCPLHPQPRVQKVVSTRVSSPQVQPESPGIPRAMVLTAYGALSPATNSSCHRRRRIEGFAGPGRAGIASANLTPATGARTIRFCRPRPVFAKRLRRVWYPSVEALVKAEASPFVRAL
jgi:hypothetical protein